MNTKFDETHPAIQNSDILITKPKTVFGSFPSVPVISKSNKLEPSPARFPYLESSIARILSEDEELRRLKVESLKSQIANGEYGVGKVDLVTALFQYAADDEKTEYTNRE